MVCEPSASDEVVNVATPAASMAVPRAVAPSLNVTVPMGVPALLVTVALKVTACPTLLGLTEDVSVVVVPVPA
jgi:predicted small secreted protein